MEEAGYPERLYALWFTTIKEVAKEWLAINAPKAWFRPMFD